MARSQKVTKVPFASISLRLGHANIWLISYKHSVHYLNPQLPIRLYFTFLDTH